MTVRRSVQRDSAPDGSLLALDASSSGDSYFVKIKLKSISNMPAVPGGGRGEGAHTASRAEGVDNGLRGGQSLRGRCERESMPWALHGLASEEAGGLDFSQRFEI